MSDAILSATGRCLKLGRAVTFAEADLSDTSARFMAQLSSSVLVVDSERPDHLVNS